MSGRLIYLMGPSGSGKDTVLQGVSRLMGQGVWVAPRLITRPATETECGAVAVSAAEFLCLERSGAFAMSWRANGLAYGVPVEINDRLSAGCHVLVNGSRGYLSEARRRYCTLLPVLLSVPQETLYQRLSARGRENADQIDKRLIRNNLYAGLATASGRERIMVLDNSGAVADTIQMLYEYLIHSATEPRYHAYDIARYG